MRSNRRGILRARGTSVFSSSRSTPSRDSGRSCSVIQSWAKARGSATMSNRGDSESLREIDRANAACPPAPALEADRDAAHEVEVAPNPGPDARALHRRATSEPATELDIVGTAGGVKPTELLTSSSVLLTR